MPGQTQRRQTTTSDQGLVSEDVQQGGNLRQQQVGNAALQGQLPAPTSLYGELRAKLGDALAKAITENLSEDDLHGHVAPLIEQLVAKGQEAAAGDASHGLSEAQLAEAFGELDAKLKEAARELLGTLDLDGKLAGFAKDQPELLALGVIAAAVVWALKSNPNLPELSKSKELGGGHTVSGTVDLGELLNLTIEHVEAGYAFDGERTDAKARVFGGDKDGGWGGEGELSHRFDPGTLSADGRYFSHDSGDQEARGGLAWDGKRTDASLKGDWKRQDGLDQWGLGAALNHDGEKTDVDLDAAFKRDQGVDTFGLGGQIRHDGEHTDTSLKGRFDRGPGGDTGFLEGRLRNEQDGRTRELGGRANLDGSWTADGSVGQVDGDRKWKLGANGAGDASGGLSTTVLGEHSDKHDGFDHSLSGRWSNDGAWSAQGGLTGQDKDNPWSLSAQAGRTSLDPEVDWSLTGKYARQLDDRGNTVLSGMQTLGNERSASRLQLDQGLGGDHSMSAWIERERTADGVVNGLGGELKTSVLGAETYARGWAKDNNTWQAAAGISKGTANDDLSFFAEGYTGRDIMGNSDHGARAGLRWRF